MKKILSLTVLAIAFVAGSFTGFAQEEANVMEQIFQESEEKADAIAEEIGLNENDRLLLIRQIVSREQTLAKVEANQNNPNSTQDFSTYVTQANDQFKNSVNDLFGEDRAAKILTLYKVEE